MRQRVVMLIVTVLCLSMLAPGAAHAEPAR